MIAGGRTERGDLRTVFEKANADVTMLSGRGGESPQPNAQNGADDQRDDT